MKHFFTLIWLLALCEAASAKDRPLTFIENKGQVTDQHYRGRSDIDFMLRAEGGLNVYIGEGAMHYQFRKVHRDPNTEPDMHSRGRNSKVEFSRMDVELVGANRNAEIVKEELQNYYEQYYTHLLPEGAMAQSYSKISYKEIYPGIDWVIYSRNGQLEYEFVVKPGGNPKDIKLEYKGATELGLKEDGSLEVVCALGSISEQKPYSYTGKQVVNSTYKLEGNILSFEVGEYEGTLIIDPTVLWTYLCCGPDFDVIDGVDIDGQGNIYCSGASEAGNVATTGAYQTTLAGLTDAFLIKLDNTGAKLWGTYFGGQKVDQAFETVYDNNGAIYIYGITTSTSGIASTGAFQEFFSPTMFNYEAAFFAKFNLSGSKQWSTYYGGNGGTTWGSLACDNSGNPYIVGGTNNANTIATTSAHQPSLSGNTDGFIAKFDPNGNRSWGTYYGGSGNDAVRDIAFDNSGNIYIGGSTSSLNDIATSGSFQSTLQGSYYNSFLAKFDASGTRLWGTYFGGDVTYCTGIDCDPNGNIIITGETSSAAHIATTNAHQTVYGGSGQAHGDGFISQFDANGNRLWGTYLGGSNDEYLEKVKTDALGFIYIMGYSKSQSGVATWNAYKPGYQGGSHDGLFAKFGNNGLCMWSSYYGTNQTDACYYIVPDGINTFYMSGMAPAGTSIYSDGFLVKFQDNSAGINEVSSEQDNVIISPNPNEGEFSINGETGLAEGVFELRVADITGRIVYTSKAAIKDRKLSSNIKLPEGLPAGVYVLTLNNADISKSILFVKK